MMELSRLAIRLSALPKALSDAAQAAAESAAALAAETARELSPVRTGALRASIISMPLGDGAEVRANRPYAALVELGSLRASPHPYLLPAARLADYPARAARAVKEALHD